MVEGIVSPNSTDSIVIRHMPFSKDAIDVSVLNLVETDVKLGPEFEDGVAIWKKQKGGVFNLTVSQAVDAVLSVTTAPHDDPFDRIVTEMRSTRSEELIDNLYSQLFSLDQWFFLCKPGNENTPVQWEFPEGLNPSPALLAFTSRERAASAAISLGIYPEGSGISIMPATVKDAVEWVSGPDCSNSWICFNLTQENFPLYCNDAVRLLQST